jgi:hypothetical protein
LDDQIFLVGKNAQKKKFPWKSCFDFDVRHGLFASGQKVTLAGVTWDRVQNNPKVILNNPPLKKVRRQIQRGANDHIYPNIYTYTCQEFNSYPQKIKNPL